MPERESEVLKPQPLSKLYILVHPLFLADHESLDEQYLKDTETMRYQALRRFVPLNSSEFLLVMPHQKEHFKQNPKWMELFLDLKSRTLFQDNVQIISDIVTAHGRYENIDTKLLQQQKGIGEQTETIIGGEYTDDCVESVAKKMLQKRDISEVKIDTRVAVYSDSVTRNILPSGAGLVVIENKDKGYILLRKVKSV